MCVENSLLLSEFGKIAWFGPSQSLTRQNNFNFSPTRSSSDQLILNAAVLFSSLGGLDAQYRGVVFPYLVRHQDQALPPGATSCWSARPPDLACPAPCLLSGVPLFHVLTPPHSQGLAWQASSPHATSAPRKQQLHLDAPGTELHASVVRLAGASGSQATPTDPLLPPALPGGVWSA